MKKLSQECCAPSHSCSVMIFFLRAGLTSTLPGALFAIFLFNFLASASIMVLLSLSACKEDKVCIRVPSLDYDVMN